MPTLPLYRRLFCHRFFCLVGGIFGAGGIAAFAAAKHIGGFYGDFAPILLGNAPVFLLLGLGKTESCLPRLAGLLIFLGGSLFTATLLALQYYGRPLFPYAAPLGGLLMIGGWLLFTAAAFCPRSGGSSANTPPTLH
ncbi:hypothetical protein [Candidatus Tokpelaia sp.]|uniref:hypothetical protein n=1 Tax=Candidatus Tokpelaia sp. TaxID=2233777 RepID=UPI001238C00C|nr:hypothetical protein [Candidatus Tokpelaia sp.]KAA6405899.1 hypothetical protein DPQ22_02765 [Candidatus Tokpelaia sp.]